MPSRGAPKKNEQRSALAKKHAQKKQLSRNGGSAAASRGTDNRVEVNREMARRARSLAAGEPIHSGGAASAPKSLKSIMELASVDEFLSHADMSQREFEVRRGWYDDGADTTTVVSSSSSSQMIINGTTSDHYFSASNNRSENSKNHIFSSSSSSINGSNPNTGQDGSSDQAYDWHALPMPERPPWRHSDSAEKLEAREVEAFLSWRRRLALTEEKVWAIQEHQVSSDARVTPYEKNLEVWRQLWRVVERSDVLVQVVDARQPLFYYSQQLHEYAQSHFRGLNFLQGKVARGSGPRDNQQKGKKQQLSQYVSTEEDIAPPEGASAAHVERLMILNKADFLTTSQRREWAKVLSSPEFRAKGLRFVWFSAKLEQDKLNAAERADRHEELQALGQQGPVTW